MRSLKTDRVVFAVLTVIAVTVVMVQTSGHSALAQQAGGDRATGLDGPDRAQRRL